MKQKRFSHSLGGLAALSALLALGACSSTAPAGSQAGVSAASGSGSSPVGPSSYALERGTVIEAEPFNGFEYHREDLEQRSADRMRASRLARLNQEYAAFFETEKLSQQVRTTFVDILASEQEEASLLMMERARTKVRQSTEEMMAEIRHRRAVTQDRLGKLLGPELLARAEQYRLTEPKRVLVGRINQFMAQSGQPMSVECQAAVVKVLFEKNIPTGMRDKPMPVSQELMERMLKRDETVYPALQALLTPEQWVPFKEAFSARFVLRQ